MLSLSISSPFVEPIFDSWEDATAGSNQITRTIDQQLPSHPFHSKPIMGLDYKYKQASNTESKCQVASELLFRLSPPQFIVIQDIHILHPLNRLASSKTQQLLLGSIQDFDALIKYGAWSSLGVITIRHSL